MGLRVVKTGLAAGLSMYTYYGTRLLPYLLLAFLAYLFVFHFRAARERLGHFALLAAGFFAGFGPLFAYFLNKLEGLKEGNSTLLDHSLIMYGSDLSVPTVHSQHDLPILVAGGASGRIAGGRYIVYPGDTTPLTNLYLTMLDKVGVPTEKLGDSTGKLNRLEV